MLDSNWQHRCIRVVCLVLVAVGLLAPPPASAQLKTEYCVEGTHTYATGCFATLRQAERFMDDNAPSYSGLMKLLRTEQYGEARSRMVYSVEPQPPASWRAPVYRIAGWADSSSVCPGMVSSDDPHFPLLCYSEELLLQSYAAQYLVNTDQCTYSNIHVTGSHADPFTLIYDTSSGGYLVQVPSQAQAHKSLRWSLYCTGWGTGVPSTGVVSLAKFQSFKCPADFRAISAASPEGIHFPKICRPTRSAPYILTRVKQCNSCLTTDGNPTIAGTGNKEYRATDFVWEGMTFTRAYNSVRDYPTDAGLGGNWAHSLSDRLLLGSTPVFLRGDGYASHMEYVDAAHYRPVASSGWALIRGSDASVPESAWRTVGEGEFRWFDAAGRLIRMQRSGRSYRLLYCDEFQFKSGQCLEPGVLTSVQSDTGRTLRFIREAAQGDWPFRADGSPATVITRIENDDQTLAVYQYDTEGRLIRASRGGAGAGLQYQYGESGLVCRAPDGSQVAGCNPADLLYHLTGVIDESGQRYATYRYDAAGRVVNSEHAGGAGRVSLRYVSDSQAEVTLAGGAVKTYGFAGGPNASPTSIAVSTTDGSSGTQSGYTYSAGRLSAKTVNGVRTDYAYDTWNVIRKREGLSTNGTVTGHTRITETDWSADYFVPAQVRTLDAAGTLRMKESWTYNSRGQVLTAGAYDPTTGESRTTTNAYCEPGDVSAGTCPVVGRILWTDGPRADLSDMSIFQYYAADHPGCAAGSATCAWRKGDLWKVTNALGQVTETLRYDGAGRVLSSKNGNGVVTDFVYDARGQLRGRTTRVSN